MQRSDKAHAVCNAHSRAHTCMSIHSSLRTFLLRFRRCGWGVGWIWSFLAQTAVGCCCTCSEWAVAGRRDTLQAGIVHLHSEEAQLQEMYTCRQSSLLGVIIDKDHFAALVQQLLLCAVQSKCMSDVCMFDLIQHRTIKPVQGCCICCLSAAASAVVVDVHA
jgi:hypothetical protein